MGLSEFFAMYLGLLGDAIKFDFHVMSQWWMYAPLLIPILLYAVFFVAKWSLITLPLWLPPLMIIGAINRVVNPKPPESTSVQSAPTNQTISSPAKPAMPFPNAGLPKPQPPRGVAAMAGENVDVPNPDDPLDALAQLYRDSVANQAKGAAFADKLMGKSPKRSKK